MATVTTYPQNATGAAWTAVTNVVGNAPSTYTILPTGYSLPSRLYVYNYDNITDVGLANLGDPKTVVQNIECWVTVLASGTPASSQRLNVFLTLDGTTKYTSGSILCANNVVAQEYTLRFYWAPTGRKFQRREIRANTAFGVFLEAAQASGGVIGVSRVKLVLNYTNDGYLQGERSTFPKAPDNIPHTVNSPNRAALDASYVIRSEQQNYLGDAIISVERACLGDSYVLGGLGPGTFHIGQKGPVGIYPEVYLFNCVVTGLTLNHLYNRTRWISGTTFLINQGRVNNFTGQTNKQSALQFLPSADSSVGWLDAYHVTGAGWVVSGGVYYPVHVTPHVTMFANFSVGLTSQVGYNVGFTTLPGPILDYVYMAGNERQLPDFRSYQTNGLYFLNAPFQIRITAIGVPRDYS